VAVRPSRFHGGAPLRISWMLDYEAQAIRSCAIWRPRQSGGDSGRRRRYATRHEPATAGSIAHSRSSISHKVAEAFVMASFGSVRGSPMTSCR